MPKKVDNRCVICELTPSPNGDYHRYVEMFDTREDAETVLKALESVNISFNCYIIKGVVL